MHPYATDPGKTLEYGYTHVRAARTLPRALALIALALALVTPFGDWPPDGIHVSALIFGGWGSGWLAYSLYRLSQADRPTLVLSRQGILHWLATDRLIPWSEVRGVRMQDVEVRAGLRLWGSHPRATAITISAAFFDRLMEGRAIRHYLFGMGHFGAKSDVVDVFVFPAQAYVSNDELMAAIETRWRAFGARERSSRRSTIPPGGGGAAKEPARPSLSPGRPPAFTPATILGIMAAGSVVVGLAARTLGYW